VAPLNAQQQAAMGQISGIAGRGNPLAGTSYSGLNSFIRQGGMGQDLDAALGYLGQTARGGTAGQNPALQAMMENNASLVGGQAMRASRANGSTGSPEHQAFLAKQIGLANNPLISQAYESDMNRQLQAQGLMGSLAGAADGRMLQGMGMSPLMAEGRYADAQKLMGVGDTTRAYQQQLRDNPRNQLGWFSNVLQGNQAALPITETKVAQAATPSTASMWGEGLSLLGRFL
jgi:hypothetical protein